MAIMGEKGIELEKMVKIDFPHQVRSSAPKFDAIQGIIRGKARQVV